MRREAEDGAAARGVALGHRQDIRLPRILTPVGIQCFDWQGGSLTPRRISASCDHGEILSREENTLLLFEGPGAHLEMILLKYINQIAGMK